MVLESSWSLEDDLKKLSAKSSMADSLVALGIIAMPEQPYEIQYPPEGWYQAGAETYIYPFSVLIEDRKSDLILKACTAFSPAASLDSILQSWIGRRELLELHGITTPRLYAWGHGVLLEERVPYGFEEALQLRSSERNHLLLSASKMAGVLTRLGFQPIKPFSDLRSHGHDAVIVDFGQDLGPSSIAQTIQSDTIFQDLLTTLASWRIPRLESLHDLMRRAFLSEVSS